MDDKDIGIICLTILGIVLIVSYFVGLYYGVRVFNIQTVVIAIVSAIAGLVTGRRKE